MAEFIINSVFSITGRGQVLVGDIVDGEISAGDVIQLLVEGNNLSLAIKSVEFVDHIGLKKAQIGLMLGFIDKTHREKLELSIGEIVQTVTT